MPPIDRASLPQEFFDITSDMLLTPPEPQYLHCQLFKSALNASFEADSVLGFSPERSFGSGGAPYQSAEAGRLMLSDGLYSNTLTVIPELGNRPGHTVRVNRPAFTNTTYTQASRLIGSGSTISVVPINVSSDQVPLTVQRFGGPYDSTNSRVAPFGVERFDGHFMQHRPAQIAAMHLKRDFDRTINAFTVVLLDQANTIVRPVGMVNDDTSAVAGDFPMSFALIKSAERQMDDANIPTFANGRRAMALSPYQLEQLSQDAQFSRLSEFHKDMNSLYPSTYQRTIGSFDVFKSTTMTTSTNTNSISINYGQAWGPGCIGAGVAELPRTAYSTADNYGELALVIWLFYLGLGTLDNRFIARLTTS
jgi:hypothetical protein